VSSWTLDEGRLPTNGTEMAMDRGSFKDGDFSLGDTVTVIGQAGTRDFTLVGVFRFGDADSAAGASVSGFDLATAQEFLGQPGQVDAVLVAGDGSVSQEELAARIQAAVPEGIEVLTGAEITAENQNAIEQGLSFFNTLLLVFAGVGLFVGSFIIYNTFAITVTQRMREHALLRAVGAGRSQVVGSLLIEAVIIGVVASLIGFGLGILLSQGLRSMLVAFGIDIPTTGLVVAPRAFVIAMLVGTLITVVAAVMPSIRASRVPPVAAMRDVEQDRSAVSHGRIVSGLVVTGLGIAALVAALAGGSAVLFLGAPVLFVGLFILGPIIARPFARLVGTPLPATRGITGVLARENAARNPKRTARTAAALLVGVALVAGVTVLAASIKSSIREIIGEQFTGDFVLNTSGGFGFGGLPLDAADRLNELPEVEAAAGVGIGFARLDGDDGIVSLVDPTTAGRLFDLEFVAGAIEDLDDEGLLVSSSRAESDGKSLGDTYQVTFLDGVSRTLAVQGIYEKDELAGPFSMTKTLYGSTGADQFDFSVFMLKADGVSEDDARAAIETVTSDYPNAKLQSRSEYVEAQAAQIDQFVNLVYALLALSIIIAVVGITNTLSLSVYERTRELGLLRAVGASRGQVRSTIRWESVITAVLGTVQGIIVGLLLAYAVILALRDEGLGSYTIPWAALGLVLGLAVLAGVVAAWWPARRAARLDVLDAISYE
jgi:putative ABC transport system permease protein